MKNGYKRINSAICPADVSLVTLVDGQAKQVPSPTNQDILNAVNDLHKKVNQLSKNQQALEQKLSDVNWNVTHGAMFAAEYAHAAAFCIQGNLTDILQDLVAIQKGWSLPCTALTNPSPYFTTPPHWK